MKCVFQLGVLLPQFLGSTALTGRGKLLHPVHVWVFGRAAVFQGVLFVLPVQGNHNLICHQVIDISCKDGKQDQDASDSIEALKMAWYAVASPSL